MRIEKSVTAVTWIPSEAIEGMPKVPFELGITHYDSPPPDRMNEGDLEVWRDANRFREANRLRAWIEVEHGKIVGAAYSGGAVIGTTRVTIGPKSLAFPGVTYPLIQKEPEIGPGWVKFVQTAGGRMGLPAPRRVSGKPFLQIASATAWTTLELVVHRDGTSTHQLAGASPFPRHWLYGDDGEVIAKSGVIEFKKWYRKAFGKHSPWGDADSPALVTAVETALERTLSEQVMKAGEKPDIRKVKQGKLLTEQGKPGDEIFLLLDGVLAVEVDGEPLAELGPGALLGERAVIEGGLRTSTLRAVTRCTVACASGDRIDKAVLAEVAEGHRREDQQA